MVPVISNPESLRRLFAALTEHTFHVEVGVADPRMIDYLTDLLVRFVRMDRVYACRDGVGRQLEDVAEMMMEGEEREGRPKREIHRHIGDFTLFWAGVYPEALKRLQSSARKDHLVDYCEQGKRAYYIASTFDDEQYAEEADVLRRLSDQFELCSFGLGRVRKEWERMPASAN